MPQLTCPINDCTWKSQDLDEKFAAALNTALQGHLNVTHIQGTQDSPSQASTRPEKLHRPLISKGSSSEDWSYFVSTWTSYKNATKLSAVDVNVQLLACCDADLRRDLHRVDRLLEGKAEKEILAAIQGLAVRQENIMVSRLSLHNMNQDRDEGVRSFAARLKGRADTCNSMYNAHATLQQM